MALPGSVAQRVAQKMMGARRGVRAAKKSQAAAMSKSKKVPFARKPRTVSLGQKGSFQINHPGVFRAKAQAAGQSTAAYAQQEKGAAGATGRQARSAIGLMAMGN